MTGEAQLYVCEDCGRVGPLPEGFSDDCRPGWTHGRFIKITSDPDRYRLRVALNKIATAPLVDINPDGADQASEAMQIIARVALGGVYA